MHIFAHSPLYLQISTTLWSKLLREKHCNYTEYVPMACSSLFTPKYSATAFYTACAWLRTVSAQELIKVCARIYINTRRFYGSNFGICRVCAQAASENQPPAGCRGAAGSTRGSQLSLWAKAGIVAHCAGQWLVVLASQLECWYESCSSASNPASCPCHLPGMPG